LASFGLNSCVDLVASFLSSLGDDGIDTGVAAVKSCFSGEPASEFPNTEHKTIVHHQKIIVRQYHLCVVVMLDVPTQCTGTHAKGYLVTSIRKVGEATSDGRVICFPTICEWNNDGQQRLGDRGYDATHDQQYNGNVQF